MNSPKQISDARNAIVKAAIDLRDSGYDGPFIGEVVTPLFNAIAEYEKSQMPEIKYPDKAMEILSDLRASRWTFMKGVKRFNPDSYPTIEERYAALEAHHKQETEHLLVLLRELCECVEATSL